MDVEQLHVVLQQSFSPDANLRVPAEETIRNLKHVKGSTTLLLQVAAEKQVSGYNSPVKYQCYGFAKCIFSCVNDEVEFLQLQRGKCDVSLD